MSVEESYGSHSLTSFAAQLERPIPQSPQLKKMAPRRKLTETAKDLPPELYEKLKTPERETADEHKKRVQKITREWAKRWVAYQWLNPQHDDMFAVNPPLKTLGIKARPPPAPGVIPDPTTLRTPEDFPAAHEQYLKRTCSRVKNLVRDMTASIQIPPQDQSQPRLQPPPQHRKKAPGMKPSQKTSAKPRVVGSSYQRTDGAAPSSRIRTDESGAPEASTTMPQSQLKTKTVLQHGPRPSPKKTAMRGAIHHTPQSSDDEDEFEDMAGFVATEADKIEYVRAAARRKAEATGSEIPLLLDPKKILEYIEIWSVKPDTPLDYLDIPKDIKFYVQQFLINEIHQRDLQKQLKAQLKKVQSDFKKKPVTDITPQEFIEHQCEVQRLNTEYAANRAYIGKSKEWMSKQMANLMKLQQPQASVPPAASAPQAARTEELSQSLKRRSKTDPPSTPPAAKKPSVEAQTDEPIDARPISSAPPTSRAPESSATPPAASIPQENTKRRLVVFTPPSKTPASALATPIISMPLSTIPPVPPRSEEHT